MPIVQELVQFHSVLDVGCGRGAWLAVCRDQGAKRIVGYDGDYVNRSSLLIPESCFRPTDLSKPFTIDDRFDLAICVEVAEHLPARMARLLVKALTGAAPAVLFSAAIPGQGGTKHINEQWPAYWQRLFAGQGFRRLDWIRPRIWHDHRVEGWYRQNCYLFVSQTFNLASDSGGADECLAACCGGFELISSHIMNRYTSVSGLLKELPREFVRAIKRRLI
jgi:hypothetical protein